MSERYFRNGHIPWVKTLDLNNSEIRSTDEQVTQDALSETSLQVYPAGSVLVAMYGGYNQIGRTGLLAIPAAVNQALTAIRPDPRRLSSRYLLRALNFRVDHWKSVASSSRKDPNITGRDIAEFPLPVPPLAEQEAIAEALSDADALVEALEQLLAKKRHLKQGAMQDLLTGTKRLPSFAGDWHLEPLGEIAQPRKERVDPRRTGANEFCVELEHIEQGTGRLVGYTATSEGSSLKSVFQKDDVLFGKLRAYLRKYWLADREGVCSTEIWVLKAKRPCLIPQFLLQLVQTDRLVQVASSAYGTHMPRSDWNMVKNYEVWLPPVPEQAAIVAILSDMDAEIAALESEHAKARQLKQGMTQELLTGKIRLA
jgi:type I restriction enzyme S subunit